MDGPLVEILAARSLVGKSEVRLAGLLHSSLSMLSQLSSPLLSVQALLTGAVLGTLIALTAPCPSLAAPTNPQDYTIFDGGMVDIEPNAFIEGSVRNGGIQPDYYVDLETEPLKSLLDKARAIRPLNVSTWDRVGMVIELIKSDFFKYRHYWNPYYRRLLKKYRVEGKDIPLSQYFVCGAGVCREYSMALHFALKVAGVENKYVYATIYRAGHNHDFEITEDHAFNVIEHEGTEWVVDAYYEKFNGYKLSEVFSPVGVTETSKGLPFAQPLPGTRKILSINSFPKVYNPLPHRCEDLLPFR